MRLVNYSDSSDEHDAASDDETPSAEPTARPLVVPGTGGGHWSAPCPAGAALTPPTTVTTPGTTNTTTAVRTGANANARPTGERSIDDAGAHPHPHPQPRPRARPPPLPPGFRDLYAGTVRSSPNDDASLHHGRMRVAPHVAGNWPTHVYVEWQPAADVLARLSSLIERETESLYRGSSDQGGPNDDDGDGDPRHPLVQSLLKNDLGVWLPLHVSLSRPLMLKTPQKSDYLARLRAVLHGSGVHAFHTPLQALRWHPNESKTRWFLVVGLQPPAGDELRRLLDACNGVAREFGQPVLYGDGAGDGPGQFHVSIAWSLQEPSEATPRWVDPFASAPCLVPFDEVKVRIGQDVTSMSLPAARTSSIRTPSS